MIVLIIVALGLMYYISSNAEELSVAPAKEPCKGHKWALKFPNQDQGKMGKLVCTKCGHEPS